MESALTKREAVLGHLAAVYDEMEPQALKAALGAMTDVAEELMTHLVASTQGRVDPTELILRGNGRPHVVGPLPSNPDLIGAVPAQRLASILGFTAVWAHRREHFGDNALDNYEADLDRCDQALASRAHSQLILIETFLQSLASDLASELHTPTEADTPPPIPGHQHDADTGCRLEIARIQGTIVQHSRKLYDETGTIETAVAIHRQHFPEDF